jgi:hypothetical protein
VGTTPITEIKGGGEAVFFVQGHEQSVCRVEAVDDTGRLAASPEFSSCRAGCDAASDANPCRPLASKGVRVKLPLGLLQRCGRTSVRASKERRHFRRGSSNLKKLGENTLLFVNILTSGSAGVSSGLVGEAVGFGIAEPRVVDPKLRRYGLGHVGLDFYRGELYCLGGIEEMSCILVAVA